MTQIKTDIESKKAEIESIEKRRDKIAGELEQCNNQVGSYKSQLEHVKEHHMSLKEQFNSILQEIDTEGQREN